MFLLSLARTRPPLSEISYRLFAFYDWCARVGVPEVTKLAKTVVAWWPQVLAFIDTGITKARTEAINRMIKDAARIAFGFRSLGKPAAPGAVAVQADDVLCRLRHVTGDSGGGWTATWVAVRAARGSLQA